MPLRNSVFFSILFACTLHGTNAGYSVVGPEAGSWPQVLSSIGLLPSTNAYVTVARAQTPESADWKTYVDAGGILILEGESHLSGSFGFISDHSVISIASIVDVHAATSLILANPLILKHFSTPKNSVVFAKDRWSDTPVMAGMQRGKGAVLWVAMDPGKLGFENLLYLPQALADLGFIQPFHSQRTWAFFDYSYRTRVDVDYFASKWKNAGISALHVASWHFYETDAVRDAYLLRLIEACHREGILVYAWIELPHVSQKFWTDHPEWREKTAVLQDAALDWRKLMNLQNPDCFRTVSTGISEMLHRFNWDGVNVAELYFESLEGAANPSRFTPLNGDVRREFKQEHGFDPIELWSTRRDPASLRTFLDYRALLARHMQERWLQEIEKAKTFLPDLDIVLTHVDDQLDSGMTDAIGANSSHALLLLAKHNFTFLIEDPATVWNLGPQRYTEIAKRYPASPKLAIDINVVERYQDVYPTKQQSGLELFELLHVASLAFPRVALYFENSLSTVDLGFLSAASAIVTRYEQIGSTLFVDSPHGFLLSWSGGAKIDGKQWAAQNASNLIVPAGPHSIQPAPLTGSLLTNFNGELLSASSFDSRVDIQYSSNSRALATLDCEPSKMAIDNQPSTVDRVGRTVLLPAGLHHATFTCK